MKPRGAATRERLLDVAEELFAANGIENVSLTEIRRAADQGNAAAVQYHFGDREGMLQAIADRHVPRLVARHEELLREAQQGDPADMRNWVRVIILPFAEYVELGPSERSWIRIYAEQQSRPSPDALGASSPEAQKVAGRMLFEHVCALVPTDLALERMISAPQAAVHMCADRALALAEGAQWAWLPASSFAENLIDMTTGALLAVPHRAKAPK